MNTLERLGRSVTHDWLAHLGYAPEEIAVTDGPPRHTANCELAEHGWECFDENLVDQHPEHTAACEAAELVMFTLEHPLIRSLLRTPTEPVDPTAGG